jgi:phosphatidylglycerol:prolipoprotein diacylglycerol transferase
LTQNLIAIWQHIPEHINPNIFTMGSFQFRYYSLMYIVAFCLTYFLLIYRIKTEKYEHSTETVQDFLFLAIIGLILGARLGYVFFYNFGYYMQHPLEIISPFSFDGGFHFVGISGMSYHGGAIGVVIASLFFCYRNQVSFWHFGDLVAPIIPLGYTFGRIGNFINGELYGRVTTVPWGMYFPSDPTHQLRHPSQIYEAFFEGLVLFTLLWLLRRKKYFEGFFLSIYIMGYGFVRFFIEFYREPDSQLGFVLGAFSMGQVLCILMILSGLILFAYGRHRDTILKMKEVKTHTQRSKQ